jgi:hypothetical protein
MQTNKNDEVTEPTVKLCGEHLMVAFVSVLDTLLENSKDLAEQMALVEQLKSELVTTQAQRDERHQDSARLDSFAQNPRMLVHNQNSKRWSVTGNTADFNNLRDAIDAIPEPASETPQ